MGKVKSTIITVIFTLAVVTLLLFSVISCGLPNGVERYNSILSNIHLGSDLSGSAYATLLPDGVITAEEYQLSEPSEDGYSTKKAYDEADDKYKYGYVKYNGYYIEKETLEDYIDNGDDIEQTAIQDKAVAALVEAVSADADKLSARFSYRELTSYSVEVVDSIAIRVAVPTNFTYAAYVGNDNDEYTSQLSSASTIISYLTAGGELTLRNSDSTVSGLTRLDDDYGSTGSLINVNADITKYFKKISAYSMSGSYAVKIKLTSAGQSLFKTISTKVSSGDDNYIRFYVGTSNIINLTCESVMDDDTFYIQTDDYETALNYASLLNSVATGGALSTEYSYDEVAAATSAAGVNTAMLLAIAVLIIMVAIMAYSVYRYKLLGLVLSLMMVCFALVLIVALFFIGTQLTTAGIFVALLCLIMFVGCNYWSFESIRKEVSVGRTMVTAIKTGYRKTVSGILDLHLVLIVASILLALVGVGEIAACGVILLICSVASYVLHWLGRFMWHVTMSYSKTEAAKRKYFGLKAKSFEEMEEELDNAAKLKKSKAEV